MKVSCDLPDDLAEDLEAFRDSLEFKPDRAEVIRRALREYLDQRVSDRSQAEDSTELDDEDETQGDG